MSSHLAQAFLAQNPHFSSGGPALPQPEPTDQVWWPQTEPTPHPIANPSAAFRSRADVPADATRVVNAGGALSQLIMHPTFVPMEALYRRLPEEGMFTATPTRSFKFELGAFAVPRNMTFAFIDYRFDVYRLSGAAPGDTVPIENRRLSTMMGWDVTISEYRKGNLRYELDPVPIQTTLEAYTTSQSNAGVIGPRPPGIAALVTPSLPTANQSQFNIAQFANTTSIGGPGLSLLPQRTERQGPLPLPFTYMVKSSQRVQFEGYVFRALPIPIAFFEVSVTGILMPASTLEDMLKGMIPSVSSSGGK